MGSGRYTVRLEDLERAVRVPVEEQGTVQDEPPAEGPWSPEERDRQRLLGITGAGRLRPEQA